jgi:hypothetical protein
MLVRAFAAAAHAGQPAGGQGDVCRSLVRWLDASTSSFLFTLSSWSDKSFPGLIIVSSLALRQVARIVLYDAGAKVLPRWPERPAIDR